jgi:hypothetical protein
MMERPSRTLRVKREIISQSFKVELEKQNYYLEIVERLNTQKNLKLSDKREKSTNR